jgi:hypothetical protein
MKTLTLTLTVPDHVQFDPTANKHLRILDQVMQIAAYAFDVDLADIKCSIEAEMPVVHPRRLGVITGITREGL